MVCINSSPKNVNVAYICVTETVIHIIIVKQIYNCFQRCI